MLKLVSAALAAALLVSPALAKKTTISPASPACLKADASAGIVESKVIARLDGLNAKAFAHRISLYLPGSLPKTTEYVVILKTKPKITYLTYHHGCFEGYGNFRPGILAPLLDNGSI